MSIPVVLLIARYHLIRIDQICCFFCDSEPTPTLINNRVFLLFTALDRCAFQPFVKHMQPNKLLWWVLSLLLLLYLYSSLELHAKKTLPVTNRNQTRLALRVLVSLWSLLFIKSYCLIDVSMPENTGKKGIMMQVFFVSRLAARVLVSLWCLLFIKSYCWSDVILSIRDPRETRTLGASLQSLLIGRCAFETHIFETL